MTRPARRPCPICNCLEVEGLRTLRFELPAHHPLANGYEVVACTSCGFVYADTDVPQEAYDRFYAELSKYEDAKTSTGGGHAQWDRERLEQTARQIADCLPTRNARILDIGCANGGLLKALKDLGFWNLCGLDPSPACVVNTQALGIEAHTGSLFQPFGQRGFDCVVLSHTLEHVQDLRSALKFVNACLGKRSAAILYVEVPDASRYKDFVFAPFQDFNTEHINHFSFTSLQNLVHGAGFRTITGGQKTIQSSPGMPYPATFAFAQRKEGSQSPVVRDLVLVDNIRAYIALSQQLLDKFDDRIRSALTEYPSLIVWGTGQLTFKLLAETALKEAKIIAFVDSNPINQGKMLHGIDVISPEATRAFPDPILIASTLHQKSIAEQILSMDLKNEVILLQ